MGSSEISDGLSAVYRFEHKLDSIEASLAGGGRLSFVGLSGGFGTITAGQIWSASYNSVGAITDNSNLWGDSQTSYRVGNAVSYAISTGNMSLQIDAIMDESEGKTDNNIDQLEFGLAVDIGDIAKVAFAHIRVEDYTETVASTTYTSVSEFKGQLSLDNTLDVTPVVSTLDVTPVTLVGSAVMPVMLVNLVYKLGAPRTKLPLFECPGGGPPMLVGATAAQCKLMGHAITGLFYDRSTGDPMFKNGNVPLELDVNGDPILSTAVVSATKYALNDVNEITHYYTNKTSGAKVPVKIKRVWTNPTGSAAACKGGTATTTSCEETVEYEEMDGTALPPGSTIIVEHAGTIEIGRGTLDVEGGDLTGTVTGGDLTGTVTGGDLTGDLTLDNTLAVTTTTTKDPDTVEPKDGSVSNFLAAEFPLGAVTAYVGWSEKKENNTDKTSNTTFLGARGSLGDTGVSYVFQLRNQKETDSSPWILAVNKGLGGGASLHFEHSNPDNDSDSKNGVFLKVSF